MDFIKGWLMAINKKQKNETINFIKDILIDLKDNYDYNETVIDKVLQHIRYQEGIYKDEATN